MKLFSWGANSHGQLGHGVTSEQCNVPQEVDMTMCGLDPGNIDMIVGGGGHSLILTKDSLVYGCGWNNNGQLASTDHSDLNTFSLINTISTYKPKALACGWDWSAGITHLGQLITWGSNAYSQLGVPKSKMEQTSIPVLIKLTPPLTQISCGMRHMAAVTECGRVLVWGTSRRSALGISDKVGEQLISTSSPEEGLEDIVKVACGQHHTVALTSKGRVYVWGDNKYGQLGLDPEHFTSVPTPTELDLSGLPFISANSQLMSGWTHTAIVTDDGHIINWGRNCYGQLGCSKHTRSTPWQPQTVQGIDKVKALSIGSEHNVALTASSRLMSWGWNEHGNCGTGSQEDVHQPVPVVTAAAPLEKVVCLGSGYGHNFAVADS